ncbi:hypothetical protein [Actinomadura sp. K4S16]|uniref:hypothetical protein n=1 Tax=Actinomadura sp. K4S16 TaxID=1316147 RepID=UPI0011EC0E43|nr:hypothetical protein [Actinomadura sp. K4S16]
MISLLGTELPGQVIGQDAEFYAVRYHQPGVGVSLDVCGSEDQLPKALREYLADGAEAEPVRVIVRVDGDLKHRVFVRHVRERIAEIATECSTGRVSYRLALARLGRVTRHLGELDRSDKFVELLDEMARRDELLRPAKGRWADNPGESRRKLLEAAEARIQEAIDALAGGPSTVIEP